MLDPLQSRRALCAKIALRSGASSRCPCAGSTGSFRAKRSRQQMSLQGREHQFVDRDSGRSGGLSGPRPSRRRLHIQERSLRRRDRRRADGCFVAVTGRRRRSDHRPQPLHCRRSSEKHSPITTGQDRVSVSQSIPSLTDEGRWLATITLVGREASRRAFSRPRKPGCPFQARAFALGACGTGRRSRPPSRPP